MRTEIDHLVIGANTLADGVSYVKNLLGVDIPFGGEHKKMATHNHLMQLGHDIFLEVIAVNEALTPPDRPRWYGLDDPYIRRQLREQPSFLGWVVNTDHISRLIDQASFEAGEVEEVTRGDLNWYFGLPEDGRLLSGGILPYAIEWQADVHPARGMEDLGCTLRRLEIHHPYTEWLEGALHSIGASHLVDIKQLPANAAAYLVAEIDTPAGVVWMKSLS